jgi:multiple antibiotic resistance protein
MDYKELLTAIFTLFAVIDILGSIPVLIAVKEKMGGRIHAGKATLISGGLMILFFLIGREFLNFLGVRIQSFAVGGSLLIFLLGMEMVLGLEIFKSDKDTKSGNVVPIAFPLIAGSGTLTTIMTLKSVYEKGDKNEWPIIIAILVNLVIVYFVLRSLNLIERLLGKSGLIAVRKFFGVILLAIGVEIFSKNIGALLR